MTGQPDETRSEDEAADAFTQRVRLQRDTAKGLLVGAEQALTAYNQTIIRMTAEQDELRRSNEILTTQVRALDQQLVRAIDERDAARTEVTRLGRDLDEAEGLLRDWLVWGKAIADALGLNYDTDQERDERMIADAMRMRAAIDEAVRMCNGPGSAQSEASQVKKRVGGVLAAALGGVPPEEAKP